MTTDNEAIVEETFQQALTLHRQSRPDEARALYQRALQLQPRHAQSLHLLGIIALESDDPERAAELIGEAIKIDPHNTAARVNRGNAMHQLKRYREAIESYDQAIAIEPGLAAAHYNRGNVLRDMNRHEEAIASYDAAIALEPGRADSHNNRGLALCDLTRYAEALASYERAIAVDAGYAEAFFNRGNVQRELKLYEAALASYERAMAINPDHVDALCNRGVVQRELGWWEAALESFERVIALKEDYAEAHLNRGAVLGDLGKWEEALSSYGRAVAIKPHSAEVWTHLGNALLDLGQPESAVTSYRRALEFDPGFAKAHRDLGSALRDLGKLADAEASYRQALMLHPDDAQTCCNLAVTLRLQGRAREAEVSCRRALELDPNSTASINFMADIKADQGSFDEAQQLFRRAISIDPQCSQAWAGLAGLRKMTRQDAEWLATVQRLSEQRLRPQQEVPLRYALGKYFDDVQEYEQAFSHYRRANELTKLYRPEHDRQQLSRAVDLAERIYDRPWLSRRRTNFPSSSRPVFIIGMPRSGTSLVEQILAAHPAVFGAGELSFWNSAAAAHGYPVSEDASGGASDTVLCALAEDYLRFLESLSSDANRVLDKMPGNFLNVGLIHAALPDARIIHIVRNPIDTCLSIYFNSLHTAHTYANDLDDLAGYYREYARLMKHWRLTLQDEVMLDVPYEALVDDQEGWSRKMVEFIGLPWDPRCLDFPSAARPVSTLSKWQVRQRISSSSVGRWRNYAQFIGPLLSLAP